MNNLLYTIPSQDVLFNMFKTTIMREINCVRIGRIQTFDNIKQTANIILVDKIQLEDGTIKDFPLLVDVPIFIIGNNNSYISCPIRENDDCILLFNDRDITNWFIQEDVSVPRTTRAHNISDCIALVGLRNSLHPIENYDNNSIVLNNNTNNLVIEPEGNTNLTIGKEVIKTNNKITCNAVEPENGADGSFVSQDGLTIIVQKGIITEIK